MPRRRDVLRATALGAVGLAGAMGLTASSAPEIKGAVVLPVGYWRSQFDAEAHRAWKRTVTRSLSGDSADFYPLAYDLDGWTSMGRATGDPAYLDHALGLVENMISTARPARALRASTFRDDHLGWASTRYGLGGREVPLYESYVWRYVVQLLLVLRGSETTAASVRDRSETVLAFTRREIAAKWLERGETNVYRNRTHLAAHWASIAVGLSLLLPSAPDRVILAGIARNVDDHLPLYPSSLRGQLVLTAGGAYVWSDVWNGSTPQDTSHGNGVVSYVCAAHDLTGSWTTTDIARFSRTLEVVRPAPGAYAAFVDGSGRGNRALSDGWAKLGRYDAVVQRQLETHGARDPQFLGVMALNARRLEIAVPWGARPG